MALSCPRCKQGMLEHHIQPAGAGRQVDIDECPKCHGLWLDRGEAAVVCPTVAYLDKRHIEIVALGKPGAGIPSCPRCNEVPHEFTILSLHID